MTLAIPAVSAVDLTVDHGAHRALDGISLDVAAGTTVGVLGHNGAGKTTLIGALTTLIRPSRGRIRVDGVDVVARPREARRRIGVTGQYAGLDEYLTAVENLELIGRLSGLGDRARSRAGELVDRLDLTGFAWRRVGELSGGARRRVDLAAGPVGSPRVLFLDEPSTGLDPVARNVLWDVVGELNDRGTTVVLTTQYLDEADALADHIVVLDRGRIVAAGSPRHLKTMIGGKVVHATVAAGGVRTLPTPPESATTLPEGQVAASFPAEDLATAASLVARLADHPAVLDVELVSPSLDDVFLHLATQGATP